MQNDTTGNGLGISRGDQPLAASLEAASADAQSAMESVSNIARPAVDRIAGKAHTVVDRLADAAESATATIGRRREQLGDAGSRVTSHYRRQVGEHPLAAVSIAVAAGFLIGRLLRSR